MKTKYFILSLLLGGSLSFTSCEFLDVSDELASNLTIEQAFDNVAYAKGWHANIFNCISEYSKISGATTGYQNPWPTMSDELTTSWSTGHNAMVNGYTAANAPFHRYDLYNYIRQAYILLDRIKPLGVETDIDKLTEGEVLRMKAEAKFFIAYSYFSLFELYGPVPLVTSALSTDTEEFAVQRPSVDEFVRFVDDLLQEVLDEDNLPYTLRSVNTSTGKEEENMNEMVRPTKAVVLALRAKLWVFAASKLFNGGFKEAIELRNPDGSQIFPAEDRTKWNTAKQHLEAFLNFAHANGYELFRAYNADGTENPSESVYQVFQDYNREVIWATTNTIMINGNSSSGYDGRCRPRDIFNGTACLGVTQQMIDAFFTNKGLDIHEDPDYNEAGFTDIENPCAYYKPQIDKQVFNMYVNREPRFYHAVTYHGKSWHIQPVKNYSAKFGWSDALGESKEISHYTGYYLYKRANHTILKTGSYNRNWARPSFIYRLADFYLYYAEVCNEVNPNDPNVIKYLDLVRERAGIPGYQKLHDDGIKTDVIGNYESQAKAIRRERQIELYTEGQRWFDIRRWMICGPGEEADMSCVYGMNVRGESYLPLNDPNTFFKRVVARTYSWNRAMYLHPIPHNEVMNNPNLVQNPLWYSIDLDWDEIED